MECKTDKRRAGSTGSLSRHRIQSVGKRTSLSIENEFWEAFNEIATLRRTPPIDLLARAIAENPDASRSSAVRLFVLAHFRRLAAGETRSAGTMRIGGRNEVRYH